MRTGGRASAHDGATGRPCYGGARCQTDDGPGRSADSCRCCTGADRRADNRGSR
jgi:hypothetical protein